MTGSPLGERRLCRPGGARWSGRSARGGLLGIGRAQEDVDVLIVFGGEGLYGAIPKLRRQRPGVPWRGEIASQARLEVAAQGQIEAPAGPRVAHQGPFIHLPNSRFRRSAVVLVRWT